MADKNYLSKIVKSGNTIYIKDEEAESAIEELRDASSEYLTIEALYDDCEITLVTSDSSFANTIEYSTDLITWTSTIAVTSNVYFISLSQGEKVYLRGTNSTYSTGSAYHRIRTTTQINVYGNIMSLIYGDSFKGNNILTESYVFSDLFYFSYIKDASRLVLPATVLTPYCYRSMFEYCQSMVSAPVLPVSTLATGCYARMFFRCTSLTTAPELPSTALASECYSLMFYACTSLQAVPELPATTLASSCYNRMFETCTAIKYAELKAPYPGYYSYHQMFNGCTALTYVKLSAIELKSGSLENWLSGVASSGTIIYSGQITLPSGDSGVPSGWTLLRDYYTPAPTYDSTNKGLVFPTAAAFSYDSSSKCITLSV